MIDYLFGVELASAARDRGSPDRRTGQPVAFK